MTFSFILIILCCGYATFLWWCKKGWMKIKKYRADNINFPFISVIVAIRNEEQFIEELLKCLIDQNYPSRSFEIVIVDDHSDDRSFNLVEQFISDHHDTNIKIIHARGEGKKSAIDQAIKESMGDLILTTDADCRMGKEWMIAMSHPLFDEKISFVAGPVVLKGRSSVFSLLQKFEMLGLMGIGGGAMTQRKPMMCNGANLCYRKSTYFEIEGFAGTKFASGDDTQLMRKLSLLKPNSLCFVKEPFAIVFTKPQISLSDFWFQRRRWSSKIPFTLSFLTVSVAALAWFVHVGLLIHLIGLLFYPQLFLLFLTALIIKISAELIFIRRIGLDLKEKSSFLLIVIAQPIYWLYISVIGAIVPIANYKWKGRKVK